MSSDVHAQELASNLTGPDRTAAAHRHRAAEFLATCAKKLKTREFVVAALRLVQQRRAEIAGNDISKGQGGKILEPGFKIIFPQPSGQPGPALTLSPSCEIG
jgi:hypothetical protein